MPATFSLQTKLPPDDRSYGYDRGTVIDRGWDDSTTKSALEFAQIAVSKLALLLLPDLPRPGLQLLENFLVARDEGREDAGLNAATGLVRRFGDTTLPLNVDLQSLDTSEVTVPPMVTINAGSQRGPAPAHATIDTTTGLAEWWSPFGQDSRRLWEPAVTAGSNQ